MPGNQREDTGGPDPDPSPYLKISYELRQKFMTKPYDAKKSVWVPNKNTGGYDEGLIETTDGDKVTVKILENNEKKVFKKDQVGQVNPPKFDGSEDMANMTFLNDACVLWNSVVRYKNQLIYTYSGLFCIAINPYKRFPIYTQRAIKMYIDKRRNEVPPHIFGVAEGSYQGLMQHQQNQSILITGESGAGKTENTKKVISYFAHVGATDKKCDGHSLEEKVVQTNPVMEAWGNAKTVRNDNSSRFGKFIRIWFNNAGNLSGADMVVYLLEKSRLTFQAPLERCYHSFYNIMSDAIPDIKKECKLSNSIYDYWWVSQGKVTVDSIDDKEDMQFANDAYDILGFSNEEKYNIYKLTAVVMHLGNLSKDFIPVGKEEQAEVKDEKNSQIVAKLCGVDDEWLMTYFCKPKLKVGSEWVSKGQTCAQASNSVSGIGRKVYELIFQFIADKCNSKLIDPSLKKIQYIGCLDIAGFEIFEFNGFEQICINFCNEKLQQFFNQHMFVLEQEEYVREGIEWDNIDFGMDLQKTINMFEKPMGLLSILEEESLFPKATDDTFLNKLNENLLGKVEAYGKPQNKQHTQTPAHFSIIHYAGSVSYTITGWLEKNKDPLNDTVVELFKNGSNKLLVEIFKYHPGQPSGTKKDDQQGSRKKGAGKTVSGFYKTQLDDLMKVLYKTEPSFIRCVVPNTHKAPGVVDSALVMHQYVCNGVLAGIAICRKGFPNKIPYPEFHHRYNILAAKECAKAKNDKAVAAILVGVAKLEKEKYRLGHTKIFFRAGVLAIMEEVRDDRVTQVLNWLTACARGKSSRMVFQKMKVRKLALIACQRAIRNYMMGKTWLWWQLWMQIKPKLKCNKFAEHKAEFERKIAIAEANIDEAQKEFETVDLKRQKLDNEKNELLLLKQEGGNAIQDVIDKTNRIEALKNELQKQLKETNQRLHGEEDSRNKILDQAQKSRAEEGRIKDDIKQKMAYLAQCQEDKVSKDNQIQSLKEEYEKQEECVTKMQMEKRSVADSHQKIDEDIQSAEDKTNHLNRVILKMEQGLDETEDSLEHEKRMRGDSEKIKKRVESDVKLAQETVSDINRTKNELNQVIQRKDKELFAIAAKIEDEQTLGNKYSKQLKDLYIRVEEVEEELEAERQHRSRAEKGRSTLSRDIEDIGEKLEDAGNLTATHIEMNRRREAELVKLKHELDEANLMHESTLSAVRQKHNNIMAELGDQIDTVNKMKSKSDADKANLERDLVEVRTGLDDAMRNRANVERNIKLAQGLINESGQKLDDLSKVLNEAESSKKKMQVENDDLTRQIEDNETTINELGKQKTSLTTQLEDTKRFMDSEARDRSSLLGKVKNINSEIDITRRRIDEESENKSDCLKGLSRAQAEAQLWRSKFETEGMCRIEDLENNRGKLLARLSEAEDTIESLNHKINSTERNKHRLETELDDLQTDYERIHASTAINEKRARNFDKVVGEWQAKVDDISAELEASQTESRNYNSELFRLKTAWDEASEQLEIVKRENKNLADEIKDLLDQLGEGGRSIHELDKQRRRLEVEKDELQVALEEAESALEQEENRVIRGELELGQVKNDIDKRLHEKEEEFENTRKNHQRAAESMQASLDAECSAKNEALRLKKKIESDINDLEIALDHANRTNVESHKIIKRLQVQKRELERLAEEENRYRQDICDKIGLSERKCNALTSELEESSSLIDGAERNKKQVERELTETRSAVNDMLSVNSKNVAEKRRLESVIHAMHADFDDLVQQTKNSEEKQKKAVADASRLMEEIQAEQEHSHNEEKCKRALDAQICELESRLNDAEEFAIRSSRNTMSKLENKIRELEVELGNVQHQTSDLNRSYQKAERCVKELFFKQEEERKNQDRMSEVANKLQQKIRTYKKQIEDAEEIAALNLAKFRKAQQEIEEAEERTYMAANQLSSQRNVRGGSVL